MEINITAITTTDMLTAINIFVTSFFSFLIWRATVATNKTTKAINEANEKERKDIHTQNRYLVKYNLIQILLELEKHSEKNSVRGSGIRNIHGSIEQIKNYNLSQYFTTEEIELILQYVDFIESNIIGKLNKGQMYHSNPYTNNPEQRAAFFEQKRKYAIKDMPIVREGKEKTQELLKKI